MKEFQDDVHLEWHQYLNDFYVGNDEGEYVTDDLGGFVIECSDRDWLSFWCINLASAPHLKFETLWDGNIRRFQNLKEALVWAGTNWFYDGNLPDEPGFDMEQEVDEFLHNFAFQEFGDLLSDAKKQCYDLGEKLGFDRNTVKSLMGMV